MRSVLLVLFLIGTSARAQQQGRAPQCGSDRDESYETFMVSDVFRILTDDYWKVSRAEAGMTSTAASAPRGVLNDTDACVQLRKALELEVGKDSPELGNAFELGFYYVGDYYAVFSLVKQEALRGLRVNQHLPIRIFTREKKPRLVFTVYG